MKTSTRAVLRRVVELACRAPSVHNSQPWLWRIADKRTLELYADPTRQLPVADPEGRNLLISCGAALQHAQEAAKALGLTSTVELATPTPGHHLLARIEFAAGRPPADAAERVLALEQRCTDRRRFTSWPVPDARLTKLAEAAAGWGAYAIPVTDVTARFRAELLMERAMTVQAADRRFAEEQAGWIEHSRLDGVPTVNAAPASSRRPGERPNRFLATPHSSDSLRVMESSDGLVALCTGHDDQAAWLQAGQTLSALWLHATRAGLSIVPLSQVIEVPETRGALHEDVLAGMAHPQLLLRVGWQEIARTTLPRTPRRPLDEVLLT
jgi:nitroreductase